MLLHRIRPQVEVTMVDRCCGDVSENRVAAVARQWIGTPYVHQASCKGTGTDCLGLLRGVWREVIGAEREAPGAYSADWAEISCAEPLLDGLARHLVRIEPVSAGAGDVLVFRMLEQGIAKHLAILASGGIEAPGTTMIHAYSGLSVCETHLSLPWRRRIAGAFRLPVPK